MNQSDDQGNESSSQFDLLQNEPPQPPDLDDSKATFRKGGFKRKGKQQEGSNKFKWIEEKINSISGPTGNLPPLEFVEQKFSSRSRIFVKNLPRNVKESDLKELFEKYGDIKEVFINPDKTFAIVSMDYKVNADKAILHINRYTLNGRTLIVKAAHPLAIKVKNLSPYVSNELLHLAFSVFGKIESCYILVDKAGQPTGEGIVEYESKVGINTALKFCNENCYFVTSSLKPVIVEEYEAEVNTFGRPDYMLRKSENYFNERQEGPRFARPGTFEYKFGQQFVQLHKTLNEKINELKNEMLFAERKLESELMQAKYEYETEKLRNIIRQREMQAERLKQMNDSKDWDGMLNEWKKFDDETYSNLSDYRRDPNFHERGYDYYSRRQESLQMNSNEAVSSSYQWQPMDNYGASSSKRNRYN